MTIVFIISDYGGFNNFLAELATTLSDQEGYHIHVICKNVKVIDIPDKAIDPRIEFHYVDIPRTINIYRLLFAAYKIRKLIERIKPDLIHSHFTTATFPTILFRKIKYQYWATIHGVGMNSTTGLRKILFTMVETICFKRLDRIFVLNKEDYYFLNKRYKNVIKYNCLGIGCDIDKFNVNNFTVHSRENLKLNMNLNAKSTVIAFTGRYVKFKGFDLVIKAFIKLIDTYPGKYELLLIGGIDPVHKIGLSSKELTFFNSNVKIHNIGFSNDVNKYLSITDIFLFPSKKEGLPTCILEALSMGVPVLTFNSRGNNDVIINDHNGLLIEPSKSLKKDVENIFKAVYHLSNQKGKMLRYSKNALANRTHYSREHFITEHLKYYSEFKEELTK